MKKGSELESRVPVHFCHDILPEAMSRAIFLAVRFEDIGRALSSTSTQQPVASLVDQPAIGSTPATRLAEVATYIIRTTFIVAEVSALGGIQKKKGGSSASHVEIRRQ